MLARAGAHVDLSDRHGWSLLQLLCQGQGGAEGCIRSTRAAGRLILKVLLGRGLPLSLVRGEDLVMQCLGGLQRAVAELLRARATGPAM